MLNIIDPADAYAQAAQEDRCVPRTRLRIPAQIRPSGNVKIKTIVCDLSIAGFSCELVSGMRPRSLCWLTLPNLGGLEAEVIWNNGQMVGCAFSQLMSAAVLDRVIQRNS